VANIPYALRGADGQWPGPLDRWYWDASRAIPWDGAVDSAVPITEFPFFTFLYADLHAHMMALPITLLVLAISVSLMRDAFLPSAAPGRLGSAVRLFLAALAAGALWPTNTWDYPSYMLVLGGALLLRAVARSREWSWLRQRVPAVERWPAVSRNAGWIREGLWLGAMVAVLTALSVGLYLPYHMTNVRPYSEFIKWWGTKTQFAAYLIIHGLPLFCMLSFFTASLWQQLGRLISQHARSDQPLTLGRVVPVAGGAALPLAAGLILGHAPLLLFEVAIALLGLAVLARSDLDPRRRFVGWVFLLGLGLTVMVDWVVLSGDIGRMNTVFKFYIQTWILWSVAAGASLGFIWPQVMRWVADARALWRAALTVLVLAAATYTVSATYAKVHDRFSAEVAQTGPTLDGSAFMRHGVQLEGLDGQPGVNIVLSHELEALRWMQDNIKGTPVILEGRHPGGYHWAGRVSIWTGLPAILGWHWHQKQQRNSAGPDQVDRRAADMDTLYSTPDVTLARQLIDQYDVEYIFIGQMERQFYRGEAIAKFDQMTQQGMLRLVFENREVRIYQVVAGAAG
jgi:YYY domain-containing protein